MSMDLDIRPPKAPEGMAVPDVGKKKKKGFLARIFGSHSKEEEVDELLEDTPTRSSEDSSSIPVPEPKESTSDDYSSLRDTLGINTKSNVSVAKLHDQLQQDANTDADAHAKQYDKEQDAYALESKEATLTPPVPEPSIDDLTHADVDDGARIENHPAFSNSQHEIHQDGNSSRSKEISDSTTDQTTDDSLSHSADVSEQSTQDSSPTSSGQVISDSILALNEEESVQREEKALEGNPVDDFSSEAQPSLHREPTSSWSIDDDQDDPSSFEPADSHNDIGSATPEPSSSEHFSWTDDSVDDSGIAQTAVKEPETTNSSLSTSEDSSSDPTVDAEEYSVERFDAPPKENVSSTPIDESSEQIPENQSMHIMKEDEHTSNESPWASDDYDDLILHMGDQTISSSPSTTKSQTIAKDSVSSESSNKTDDYSLDESSNEIAASSHDNSEVASDLSSDSLNEIADADESMSSDFSKSSSENFIDSEESTEISSSEPQSLQTNEPFPDTKKDVSTTEISFIEKPSLEFNEVYSSDDYDSEPSLDSRSEIVSNRSVETDANSSFEESMSTIPSSDSSSVPYVELPVQPSVSTIDSSNKEIISSSSQGDVSTSEKPAIPVEQSLSTEQEGSTPLPREKELAIIPESQNKLPENISDFPHFEVPKKEHVPLTQEQGQLIIDKLNEFEQRHKQEFEEKEHELHTYEDAIHASFVDWLKTQDAGIKEKELLYDKAFVKNRDWLYNAGDTKAQLLAGKVNQADAHEAKKAEIVEQVKKADHQIQDLLTVNKLQEARKKELVKRVSVTEHNLQILGDDIEPVASSTEQQSGEKQDDVSLSPSMTSDSQTTSSETTYSEDSPQYISIFSKEIDDLLEKAKDQLDKGLVNEAKRTYNKARELHLTAEHSPDAKKITYDRIRELYDNIRLKSMEAQAKQMVGEI